MLIKFRILWIDDASGYIESKSEQLERYMGDLGFSLEVKKITNPELEAVDTILRDSSQFDLILVDWKYQMNPNELPQEFGLNIIEAIRTKVTYSDIIFYSSDLVGLKQTFSEHGLQGVYLSYRDDLVEDAQELIQYLLHKYLHPKVMRGLLIGEVAHLDKLSHDIISKKYSSAACDKTVLLAKIKQNIFEQLRAQRKGRIQALRLGESDFIESLYSTIIFDSFRRSKLVKELSSTESPQIEGLNKLLDIVDKRNKLAHWKKTSESDDHITLTEEGRRPYIFNQNEAIKLRKEINRAAKAMNDYVERLNGNQ